MKKFSLLLFGELISSLGSGILSFCIGVYVFQETKSTSLYSLVHTIAALPAVFCLPIAGSYADRHNPKTVLIKSNILLLVGSLTLAVSFYFFDNPLWVIFLISVWEAIFASAQWPAINRLMVLMVPKEKYGNCNGLLTGIDATTSLLAPLLAGAVYAKIGINGIAIADSVSFLLVVFLIAMIPFEYKKIDDGVKKSFSFIISELKDAYHLIKSNSKLSGLFIFIAITATLGSITTVFFSPLILSMFTEQELGIAMSIGGIGFLLGSIFISVKGLKNNVILVGFSAQILASISAILGSLFTTTIPIYLCVFSFLFFQTFITSSALTLIQTSASDSFQGRLAALRKAIVMGIAPLSLLGISVLIDFVFVPYFPKALHIIFPHPSGGPISFAIFSINIVGIITMFAFKGSMLGKNDGEQKAL